MDFFEKFGKRQVLLYMSGGVVAGAGVLAPDKGDERSFSVETFALAIENRVKSSLLPAPLCSRRPAPKTVVCPCCDTVIRETQGGKEWLLPPA